MSKSLIACVGALLIFSVSIFDVLGLPNSIVGFQNPAGMRLEDFAAQKSVWSTNAKLPGNWQLWKDESVTDSSIELLHLNMAAVVFGVTASEVTVQRKDDVIIQFKVVFETNKRIKDFDKLNRIIKSNASLWSGEDAEDKTMEHGTSLYSFNVDANEDRVVVLINPKKG